MAELNDWNIAAASNNSTPPDGWPENMAYSEVNNSAREGMAVVARFFKDMNGSLNAGGVADAYTVTLNASYAAYFTGMTFTLKIGADNTGASTINVNALGAKAIVNADGGALNAGQLKNGGIYRLSYDGTNFVIVGAGAYGSMALQDANAVAITGGSIAGITDLAVADGGTGASTASAARSNLGLGSIATQAANAVAITGGSITGITDLAIADGGTGAGTASAARSNLGLGSIATQAANAVAITGGSITGITDLAIADGGTGASTASGARTALGLGSMATVNSPVPIANGGTASTTAAAARTALGLGSIATQSAASVAITGGSITGITDLAIADGGTGASTASGARTALGLGSLATLSSINNGNWSGTDLAVVNGGTGASDVATARSNLGLGSLATLSSINNSNWSGTDLAVANGGTGASDAATARANLGITTPDIKHKTADQTKNNNTLTDDNHLAGWTIAQATFYKFEAYLKVSSSGDATPNIQIKWNLTAPVQEQFLTFVSYNEAEAVDADSSTFATTHVINLGANENRGIILRGFLLGPISGSATLNLQFAQNVTSASFPVSIERGSWASLEAL